jgi:tripartite-type tricarboxylate transporter receptor subunit TctC
LTGKDVCIHIISPIGGSLGGSLVLNPINLGLTVAAIIACTPSAQGQTTARYPSGPVKLIVPYAPGGLVDTISRQIGNALSPGLGQPIVVENRPGAGGRLAASVVANAAPDGQTLLFTTLATLTLSPLMPPKADFDVARDFKPMMAVAKQSLYVAARDSLQANDLRDVVALAKREPTKLTYGSPGTGTEAHLVMARFARNAGIDLVHIPYRGGGPAVTDIIAGRIDLVALSEIALRPALDSGKGKLLAALDPVRVSNFSNIPSVVELGYPRDVYVPSVALFGPSKLSDEIVTRWVNLAAPLKTDAAFLKAMKDAGSEVSILGPAELGDLLNADRADWQRLIEQLGIKAE